MKITLALLKLITKLKRLKFKIVLSFSSRNPSQIVLALEPIINQATSKKYQH